MRKKAVILIALAGFAAMAAALGPTTGGSGSKGGKGIEERRALDGNAALSVRNTAGSIKVEAWDKSELELTGRLGDGVERLEIAGSSTNMKIDVRLKHGLRPSYTDTLLVLRVPAGVNLTLEGTSADLLVSGVKGKLTARTVSGDVGLNVESAEVSAQTVSGDVHLDAPKATHTSVSTVSGGTQINGPSGTLHADSVSGDIDLNGGSFTQLDLKSVSGDVQVRAATTADAEVKAESLSGDVRFNATRDLNAKVALKSFSGDKHCELDAARPLSDGKRMIYTLGEGKGQISLTSFSGNVVLQGQ